MSVTFLMEVALGLVSQVLKLQDTANVNILVTSRFIPEITIMSQTSLQLEIRARDEDVKRYLDSHMS